MKINRSTKQILLMLALGLGIYLLGHIASCRSNKDAHINDKSAPTIIVTPEQQRLQQQYQEMLTPIDTLRSMQAELYWYIVSWLGTAYGTPSWKGYDTHTWQQYTKKRGIDCSGYARVLQDRMWDRQVKGSAQGILDQYCTHVSRDDLKMGDLVFFKAPHSKSNRIVHVGTYLLDGHFVHATSSRSAAQGLGLSINSLHEPRWSTTYVAGGRVKESTY